LRFLEDQLAELDECIRTQIGQAGYEPQWELLQSVPGLQETTAATILAEMGPNPKQFPSEKKLSWWAGVAPGNNQSAGKSKSSSTQPGNRWLKSALAEAAWGVSGKKDCHLQQKFRRIAASNQSKAVVASAHDILVLAYSVLQRGTPYVEKGPAEFTETHKQRIIRHRVRRLGKLGIRVRTPPPLIRGSPPGTSPGKRRGRPCKCAERGITCQHAKPQLPTSAGTASQRVTVTAARDCY
jgi:hypothetical protein